MKLMIVDDSNVIRSRIARIASNHRSIKITEIKTVPDGIQAIETAQQLNPDVVTMDLTMPQMDGLETIYRLMKNHPDIKILVISAMDDKTTAIRALQLGAIGFLGKPFSDEELLLAFLDITEA